MTVPTQDNRVQYVGAGTTDPLSVPFLFLQNSDLQVTQLDLAGVQTTLLENTDYAVTGAGNAAGGTVTPLSTFTTGYIWTILRVVPLTQETDFQPNDPLPAETLERSIDKVTMGLQQLAEQAGRAATIPVSSNASGDLPQPQANKLLGWKSDGSGIENKDIPAGTAVYSTVANTRLGAATGEAVTPAGLASLWKAGSNLVSAASIAKPADANLGGFYTQTGNTGTNNYWAGSVDGEEMEIRHTGAPLLGISGNIIPPGGIPYQVVAGDIIRYRWDGAVLKWRAISGMHSDGTPLVAPRIINSGVRQTVMAGPVDANGLPSFGGATGGTTVTATGTLTVSAANGFGSTGPVDRIGQITNPAWTGLSTNGTMYLYVDVAADGTCTPGSTTLAPTYRRGGADVITNGQFTFNINEMVGKVGNGTTASQTYRVFVGEVTVVGAVVTAIIWYALNGRFDSDYTNTWPAAGVKTSFNHNIGLPPISKQIHAKCLTAEIGYAAGEEAYPFTNSATSVNVPYTLQATRNSISFTNGSNVALVLYNGTTGTLTVNPTLANWAYRVTCSRGWGGS